jgi:hypothetical protein
MAELILARANNRRRKKTRRVGLRRSLTLSINQWVGWSGILLLAGALVFLAGYFLLLGQIRGTATDLGKGINLLSADVRGLEIEVDEMRDKYDGLNRKGRLQHLAAKMKLAPATASQKVVLSHD